MAYRIAWDNDPDDPNPHPWMLGEESYATDAEAAKVAAEHDAESQRDIGDDRFVGNWTIVYDPEKALGVTVTVTESAGSDGAVVVFIDTEFEPDGSDGPGLRVLINDSDTYIGVPYQPREEDIPGGGQ